MRDLGREGGDVTVADRYEGQDAGTCGCGSRLVWTRCAAGKWCVTHADPVKALACSSMYEAVSDVDETAGAH